MYYRPIVEVLGKTEQVLRRSRQTFKDNGVQGNPDWHLDYHRAQAAYGVYAMLLVQLHGLF